MRTERVSPPAGGGFARPVRCVLRAALPLAGGLGVLLGVALVGCGDGRGAIWQEAEGYRWLSLHVRGSRAAGFTALPPERTGVTGANELAEASALVNRTLADGSGVAIGDVDGDGLADLYLPRIAAPNLLYRNHGDWQFEDVTVTAGVALPDRASTGAAFADVDGDRDLDLLVTALGQPNSLFLNDGAGVFEDVSSKAGFEVARASRSLALADVDGDGDLDLYVTNNKSSVAQDLFPPEERRRERIVVERGGELSIAPEFAGHYEVERVGDAVRWFEFAEEDEFYLNDGSGRFELVPFTGGRFLDAAGEPLGAAPRDWGLSVRFHDMDGDADPDLYVCNDFESPDHIWLNDGSGRFREAGHERVRTTSLSCMAIEFADVDRDGNTDFFTADMAGLDEVRRKRIVPPMASDSTGPGQLAFRVQRARNTLQLGRGDGTYADVAPMAGVAGSEWTWGATFVDVNLDGWEDLVVATGHAWDLLDGDAQLRVIGARGGIDWQLEQGLYPPLLHRNLAFRNRGDGTFEEVGETWLGSEADIAHGLATGDLDLDGDLDLVLTRLNAPPLLLRSESAASRVAVRLRGPASNGQGIGALIRVLGGAVPEQRREVTAGGGYLSGSEPVIAFGTGEARAVKIEVVWPGGGDTTRVERALPDRLYEVFAPGAGVAPAAGMQAPGRSAGGPGATGRAGTPAAKPREPVFAPAPLAHRHTELPTDEFQRQPLLPYRLAQLGPGVSWIDVDRDGDPELAIASGRGGRLALYENSAGELRELPLGLPPAAYDQTMILGVPGSAGWADLLVGQMNYEAHSPGEARETPGVLRVRLRGAGVAARMEPEIGGAIESVGPLALADVDLDGDLDLFVGGRVAPSAYPVPVPSRLYRRVDGDWAIDPAFARLVSDVGLVSAALFTDVDGDGDADLALATEWGPVRLFRNEEGEFRDATRRYGLEGLPGRWNGLASGDLDADGRPDLIATSWGWNTEDGASLEHPLLLLHGDLDGNGTYDVIRARFDARIGGVAPLEDLRKLGTALPFLRRTVGSFAAYSGSTLAAVLGERAAAASTAEAATLSHTLLLNRGDRFEAVALPLDAQVAPAFYAGVADFDGDGNDDLFLTQNFFATPPAVARYDAGRSLWLRGDGTGALDPVPGQESGVRVYGDPRGAGLADVDGDGRIDLAVSQNGAETLLFRNRGATPGLRVRLIGPPGNPDAVGAAIRLRYRSGDGPLREVRAGSGYWSHDDVVQVLGMREQPRAVWVRWPGGEETEIPVPEGSREVSVDYPEVSR